MILMIMILMKDFSFYTHGNFVVAGGGDVGDCSLSPRRHQHLVFDESILMHDTVQVSTGDV